MPSNQTCGYGAFTQDCPIAMPTDGRGGTCYNTPIPIPLCPIANYTAIYNTTNSSATLITYTTYSILDSLHYTMATTSIILAVSLTLTSLTLLNVAVLCPSHKRRLPLHTILLVGLLSQILKSASSIYLSTMSGPASAYLLLTNDWASTYWSRKYRATTLMAEIGGLSAYTCVQIALYVQIRSTLSWLKLKYRSRVYYAVVCLLVLIGFVSWSYRAAYAWCTVRFIGFVPAGRPIEINYWFKFVRQALIILTAVSVGSWSCCFLVSVMGIVWERRRLLFSMDQARDWERELRSTDATASRRRNGRKARSRDAYEKAMRFVGLVAVESFVVPIVLCVISLTNLNTPLLEPLIVSAVLTLLPLSSLLVDPKICGHQRNGQDQAGQCGSFRQMQGGTGALTNSGSPLPFPAEVELHGRCFKVEDSGVDRRIERELAAIDRMG